MTISVHVGSTTTGSTAAMLWRESIERAFPSWPQSWRETITRFHCADPWSSRRSEEHTSELQSLMRISYAVFCLKKKKTTKLPYAKTVIQTEQHNKSHMT